MSRAQRLGLLLVGGAICLAPLTLKGTPPLGASAAGVAAPGGKDLGAAVETAAGRPSLAAPSTLRVGLATDLDRFEIPCCSARLTSLDGSRVLATAAAWTVTPAAEAVRPPVYRLQVAALKDEAQARHLARRLGQELTVAADAVFDAGTDLYRVRVGRWRERGEAERTGRGLARYGVERAWVVSEQAMVRGPGLRVEEAGEGRRVPGRWLAVDADADRPLRFGGQRYRGRLLVYLNDRGSLNVVNELPVEEYLRGVVPREMGPEVYDDLDALKAQAVAARTYTLKNLGEFLAEGYDICATPRCQVYAGASVEHPLTDRAIAETAGEVLSYRGELIDALYSSTCGGHTEDVGVVFPQKREPYLKGVVCMESGVERIGTDAQATGFPLGLTRRLLPPAGVNGSSEELLAARLEHLALLAGLPIAEDRLASLARREVRRFVASVFDLALDVRLLRSPEQEPALAVPPAGRDRRLAEGLAESGLLAGDLAAPLDRRQIEETLFQLALYLRVLDRVEGRFQALDGGELRLRSGGESRSYRLPDRVATFRQRKGRYRQSPLDLLAGDRVAAYIHGDELLAIVHQPTADGVVFDRSGGRRTWTRFRSDARLAELVAARYPGFALSDLEIGSRGVSGRVGTIRLVDGGGETIEVDGLAVRWTLDLPDTLFTAERVDSSGRPPGWLFTGRGWGHGVGLCQVGAYGMGLRGHSYQEILGHYYTGVELALVGGVPPGPPAVATSP